MSPETAWSDESLTLIRDRYAADLPARSPQPPPVPPRDPLAAAADVATEFHIAVSGREYGRAWVALSSLRTWHETAALAAILAEAIGPDATRLRSVLLAVRAEAGKGAA